MRLFEFTEGMLDNPGAEDSPVAQAIIRRILLQRTDLLAKYGPEKVGQAVDEVADFVGDADEIGSSDVSGWIRHVEQMLGNMGEGVAEGLGKTIKRGMAGWGAFDKDKPADVVKRVRGQDTDTLKGLSNRGSTGKGSPAELQQKAISRELKKRGEQGVAEGSEDLELYGLRVGDTVKATFRGNTVQGDVIDIFPETQQVELLLRGANAGRTITVDVQDTEALSEQGVTEGSEDLPQWKKDWYAKQKPNSWPKHPQPYNEPDWHKNLSKEQLDALAGPRYPKDKKVSEASGYDGSEPLDLSTNPSVNDVFKRALYIYDYEGYGNDMDYSEDEAIEQYVARKFGQDVLDQLNKAKNQQYFGRADGKGPGGGGRTSNLGTSSAPGGNFRTTKAGVMNKQDAKMMKARVANRLGRHPAPNLPEAGYYNPLDQERREQDQMDYNKRAFKRAEMQHELGHEDDPDFERKQRQQAMDRDRGPWYVRIDGKIYRQGGQPKSFDWKKGANNYALAMLKNNPSLQGKILLSKNSEDK